MLRTLFLFIGAMLLVITTIMVLWRHQDSEAYWLASVNVSREGRTIIRMQPDGKLPTKLPHTIEQGWAPAWSPDGQSMSYVSGIFYDVYRIGYDGNALQMLSTCFAQEQAPNWSPDGQWIAFVSNCRRNNLALYVMRTDGSQRNRLTDHSGIDNLPRWSPDGQWIVFQSQRNGNTNVFRIRPDGTGEQQLTFLSNALRPVWSPDGQWIAFQTIGESLNFEIRVVRPDGSEQHLVTDMLPLNVAQNYWEPWSPDGEWLAFASNVTGDYELYRVRMDGTDLEQLTHSPGGDGQPSWSPDGQWIAFVSGREGRAEIYRMHPDGTNQQRLTYNWDFEQFPVWSPRLSLTWHGFRLGLLGLGTIVVATVTQPMFSRIKHRVLAKF